jgi:hypothetical protein
VAEETEGQDIVAEGSGAGINPAAVALAVGWASVEKADAFLDDQRALIAAQKHHVGEQSKYPHE